MIEENRSLYEKNKLVNRILERVLKKEMFDRLLGEFYQMEF
jgi:hypothetical protein